MKATRYILRRPAPLFHPAGIGVIARFLVPILALILTTAICSADATVVDTNSTVNAVAETGDVDLTGLSIEQLMNIKVSILGPSETVSQTPAAVSVVTHEQIKRSGALSFPEALRLVPGMDVAQVDSSQWAVSARGFNDVFANKLLVLQDGRSIYTPLFSGVFWDVQGTMMEDVDHIEVVRGPGATLWGANAVNGVINILTKSAEDTQGALFSGGGGLQDRGFANARYGGKIGDNAYYRVYGTYLNRDDTLLPDGSSGHNDWQAVRGGFRTDWNVTDDNLVTFQGDAYAGWVNQVFGIFDPANPPTFNRSVRDQDDIRGGNVLGRWTHTISDTANFKVQAYYDRTDQKAVILDEKRNTFDLNFQHEFSLGERNHFVWGLGYRVTSDTEQNNANITFSPENQTLNLFSAFAQDEIRLVKDKLSLTLGSKFEHNDYTGVEWQPGARLLWTPEKHQTFWASISRAVRTPSRADESITLTQSRAVAPGFYVPVTVYGDNHFDSENVIAYEIGYRAQPFDNFSLDLAAFYNDYDNLRSQDQKSPLNPTVFVLGNNLSAKTYGVEATTTWRVTHNWQLQPTYTFLQMDVDSHPSQSRY
ncbi:MAG TPA: TonB-dependent receptor, partial [Verrucomicrobiae bacterium]|nr:TonB-dependent receptor [Verrucomicrobiae bacterium]